MNFSTQSVMSGPFQNGFTKKETIKPEKYSVQKHTFLFLIFFKANDKLPFWINLSDEMWIYLFTNDLVNQLPRELRIAFYVQVNGTALV